MFDRDGAAQAASALAVNFHPSSFVLQPFPMSMRPVILICATSGEDRNRSYVAAIKAHGGKPVLVAPGDDFLRLAPHGVILTGGGDLSESCYNHALSPAERKTLGRIEPSREAYERKILAWAAVRNVPTLGICRGCQMLNVFAGGTLIPDIGFWHARRKITARPAHRQAGDASRPSHEVRLDPDGQLHRLLGGVSRICVNSSHHQALARRGKGLVVTARAPDRIIEAIEDPRRPFWIGVQFHPERMWRRHPVFANLFRAFLEAARRFGKI